MSAFSVINYLLHIYINLHYTKVFINDVEINNNFHNNKLHILDY